MSKMEPLRQGVNSPRSPELLAQVAQSVYGAHSTSLEDLQLNVDRPSYLKLPDTQRQIVEKVLSERFPELHTALTALVKMGGYDSARALAVLLSEVATDEGRLARISWGDRYVSVYSICKALLKLAGASRISDYNDIEPEQKLSKEEVKEIWQLLRSLAKGDHEDHQAAMGARTLLFERFCDIPGMGTVVDLALKLSMLIDGAPPGGPPRLLFVLIDLPWAFRSKIGFASVATRKGNLAEMFYRKK